jgi:hypothetical protein
VADDCLEHSQSFSSEDIEALFCVGSFGVWKPGVVFVGKGSGFEAGGVQVGGKGVIAGLLY